MWPIGRLQDFWKSLTGCVFLLQKIFFLNSIVFTSLLGEKLASSWLPERNIFTPSDVPRGGAFFKTKKLLVSNFLLHFFKDLNILKKLNKKTKLTLRLALQNYKIHSKFFAFLDWMDKSSQIQFLLFKKALKMSIILFLQKIFFADSVIFLHVYSGRILPYRLFVKLKIYNYYILLIWKTSKKGDYASVGSP